jgi:hypothetical protein
MSEATRANVNVKDARAPKAVRRKAIWKCGGVSSGGIPEEATLPRLSWSLDGQETRRIVVLDAVHACRDRGRDQSAVGRRPDQVHQEGSLIGQPVVDSS